MPGDSARDVARRRDDAVARLVHPPDGADPDSDDGREVRAGVGLDPDAWTLLADLSWPGGSFPNIDFIAVGPTGIFVVDTLHRRGTVRVRGDRLRIANTAQDGLVLAATTAARSVAEWLPVEYRPDVHAVLCFRRAGELSGSSRGALLCTTENLAATLAHAGPQRLGPTDVEHVAAVIRGRLGEPGETPPPVRDAPGPGPATLPRQRGASQPAAVTPGDVPPPLPAPRRPDPARERLQLALLVVVLSLVMVGFVLGIAAVR